MNENLFFQEQYHISNELIQTFGRKSFNRYRKQHNISDHSQQQPQNLKGIIFYQNDSPLMTFREHQYSQTKSINRNSNIVMAKQREQRKQSNHQLDSIDRINKKINGLIKSISASCEKKINLSEYRHQHDVFANKRSIFEDSIIQRDRQQTQKKKQYPYEKANIKPSLLQFKQKEKQYEMPIRQQEYSNDYNEEEFDSLDERIKRISHKIEEHEKKREKQQSNRYQQLQNQHPFKNQNNSKVLRSQREQRDNPIYNKQRVDMTLKKSKNNIIDYENRVTNFIDINKQNRIDRKQKLIVEAKQLLFKKGGYFKEKYQELKMGGKQQWMKVQQSNNRMNLITKIKTDNSEKDTDRKQNRNQKLKQQKQIINFPVKNMELLSYKTTFMKQIVKQIQLDQDFRHAKHMFGGIDNLFDQNNHNQKWSILQAELRKEGFSLDLREVKQIFMPRDDEIDPFMSVNNSHQQLIHGVIYAYQTTERHWNQNIYHNWTLWQLKEAKFNSEYLDRDHKGYINLEDLTFYVNTQVDGYYRNRDLLLIFNRLSDNKSRVCKQSNYGIKFKQIMNRLLSL